ncbi:hypothetical protein ACHAPT_009915 [Fusarium lateritium]
MTSATGFDMNPMADTNAMADTNVMPNTDTMVDPDLVSETERLSLLAVEPNPERTSFADVETNTEGTSLIDMEPNTEIMDFVDVEPITDMMPDLDPMLNMDPTFRNDIFELRDAHYLMSVWNFGPATYSGFRLVRKSTLLRFTAGVLYNGVQFAFPPQLGPPGRILGYIPVKLVSKATLQYVGFTPEAADEMWDAWLNWPLEGTRRETDPHDGRPCYTFLDFMRMRISLGRDTHSPDFDERARCMTAWGLSNLFQGGMLSLAQSYPQVLHGPCSTIAANMVQLHYDGLLALQLTFSEGAQARVDYVRRNTPSRVHAYFRSMGPPSES